MNTIKTAMILLLLVCIALASGLYLTLQRYYQPLDLTSIDADVIGSFGGKRFITILPGDSVAAVVNRLSNNANSKLTTAFFTRLHPQLQNIKAGSYIVDETDTVVSWLEKAVAGNEAQFTLALIEGLTFRQWLEQLNQHPLLTPLSEQQQQGLRPLVNLEGRLLADSYAIRVGEGVSDIIRRSQQAMDKFLQAQWLQRKENLPIASSYEALILASIVEKETAVAAERPRIAGVFVNRLRKGMRLQTDPTVIYGLGDNFDGNITRAHLRQRTAYNTYRIDGLPPTPIAMPGREAIKAVLHPLDTDELYFVARGDGSHKFSKTLAEHNQAVRKYQLKQG